MPSANTFKNFGLVINGPKEKEGAELTATLKGYEERLFVDLDYSFFASIIHDKDTKAKGEAKLSHLHVFLMLDKDMTQYQVITLVREALKCDRKQISCEGSANDILLCQYLTHQNHPEKHQYKADLIRASNTEKLEKLLEAEYKPPIKIDVEAQLEACKTLSEFISAVGLETANKYRGIFKDMKAENKERLEDYMRLCEVLSNDLRQAVNLIQKLVAYGPKGALSEEDIAEAKAFIEYALYIRNI